MNPLYRILAIAGIVVTSPLWLYWIIRAYWEGRK